ncbi:MAG TPA: metallophosphoesterase [Terracidiphilus sp.]|nr:metallophosphoesterase [Terracidiphilus sp.]
MRAWPVLVISIIQVILFLAHWFMFHTWISFWPGSVAAPHPDLRIALFALSFTFVAASLLSFRIWNWAVGLFYRLAALWLGFAHFFFLAACLTWPVWYAMRVLAPAQAAAARPAIGAGFFLAALATSLYGLVNARMIRVRRIAVRLPNLPESWRGRRAVLMSDLHLGNVNRARFVRRMVALAAGFEPDIVFLPGDVFDGTYADFDRLVAPFKDLKPPFGVYFATGNHEEFHDTALYLAAIARTGIQVLANQRVTVDGLHILGISYHEAAHPQRVRATLESLSPGANQASILLNHAPMRLPIVEEAGIGLQLSGHTHGGQIVPFNWLTRRIFGKFTHGLHRFGALQVYTSTGAGTWGPPMRVGTTPEIVVLTFEF